VVGLLATGAAHSSLKNGEAALNYAVRPRIYPGVLPRLVRGLGWVLDYICQHPAVPVLSTSKIVKGLRLNHSHGVYTDLGLALRHLARLGLLVPWRTARPYVYLVPEELQDFLATYDCLSGCHTDASVCGLYGVPLCPFLRGFGGGSDGAVC